MSHKTDPAYLATCARFGIAPSVEDYAAYMADAMAAVDTLLEDAHADGVGGDVEFG
jgi:hypothetical protein